MSFDSVGLLVGEAVLLALAQLLDQTHGLSLETAGELAANSAGEKLHQLDTKILVKLVSIDHLLPEF